MKKKTYLWAGFVNNHLHYEKDMYGNIIYSIFKTKKEAKQCFHTDIRKIEIREIKNL